MLVRSDSSIQTSKAGLKTQSLVVADNGVGLSEVSEGLYRLEKWSQLSNLLKAFTSKLTLDASASLAFSPLLTQDNRSFVHKCVLSPASCDMLTWHLTLARPGSRCVVRPDVGKGAICTASQGTGEQRHVTVMRTGAKPHSQQVRESAACTISLPVHC